MRRSNSPYINHFIQPDTIIPEQANPQSWDRYSYVKNNPILYNDPTGHSSCVGSHYDDGPECARKEGSQLNLEIKQIKYQNKVRNDLKKRIHDVFDGLIWRTIPSAFGIDFGIQGQYGLFAEAEVTPYEKQIIYNWCSNQLSVLQGSGTGGYLGSPTIAGVTGYVGIMTVYGASDNAYVAGHSKQLGASAQVDVVGTTGLSKVIGASWDPKSAMPFVDPVSGIPVSFQQTNITGGVNAFPDGFDAGVFAGQSDSEMITQP